MKTFKRELSVCLLIWLVYLMETKDVELIELVVWPIFTFAGLSFGLEFYGKSGGLQSNLTFSSRRERTQSSSEHSSG